VIDLVAAYSSLTCLLIVLAAAWKCGARVVTGNGKVVFFFPSFLYDFIGRALFILNWIICLLCYLQPEKSEWNDSVDVAPDKLKSRRDLNELKKQILAGTDTFYEEVDLVCLYDSLPKVEAEKDLVGRSWNGKILRTNKSVLDFAEWVLVRPLTKLGLAWGKRYITQHTGDPLFINWNKQVYAPLPLWGIVGVCDIKWRGAVTGTMNYDHQPWKDYFAKLEETTQTVVLLGVWTSREKAGGWFTLTLDKTVPM